jgi:hypothetical protein
MPRPFIPAANCASVEMIYNIPSGIAENRFHVRKGAPYSAADLTAVRTIFDSWDNVTGKSLRHAGTFLARIKSTALDSIGSPFEDFTLAAARAGTSGSSSLPNNATIAVKLATGLTGRSQRGRIYIIGVSVGHLQTGSQLITNTYATALTGGLNTLMTNLATGGHTLGVLSYRENGAWRVAGKFTPATGWTLADNVMDSQRRRLPGRGI